MEPISSLVVGHAAGKLLDGLTGVFRVQVIERWSKHRAQRFFDELCCELEKESSGEQSGQVNELLESLLADEATSEALFDAYRRVSLAKSKELGPRIIAIMTARLVIEKRMADDVEDRMLAAAEQLSDDELVEFAKFVREQTAIAAKPGDSDARFDERGNLVVAWYREQLDSNWIRNQHISVGPLDLIECVGGWAAKMKSLGILVDDVRERSWQYDEDSERHIDMPGSVREISWWFCVPQRHLLLAGLVDRVSANASSQ